MVLGDLFTRNARRTPDKEGLVYRKTRLTFKQLNNRVNSLTNAFIDLGLKRQDRIALIADNCHQYIEMIGACAKGGFIIASLSTKLKDELTHIVNNAQPKLVVVGPNYLGKVRPEWGFVENIICLQDGPHNVLHYEELIKRYPPTEPGSLVEEDDILFLYYTSGTTSLPKGVALTHRATLANAMNMVINFEMRSDIRTVAVHPLFFTAPINCTILPAVYLGGVTVVLDGFDPESFLLTVQEEKITNVIVVPTMLIRLLEHSDIDKYDLSSLKQVIYGSASMPVARLKEAIKRFGRIFAQGYGLTETVGPVTSLMPDQHIPDGRPEEIQRLGSCGREMLNSHVRVVHEDGTAVARDGKDLGEIVIQSDTLLKCYWNMPEVTGEALKDGWLLSGDLATVDSDGYIYIVDRKKDMIISGGINIYPREIEEVLYKHPAVFEAAVIGLPDEEWGEIVSAVIVLKEDQKATEEEIIEYCKEHLATYKKPKKVIFVPGLPKTPTGKILKRELRHMHS